MAFQKTTFEGGEIWYKGLVVWNCPPDIMDGVKRGLDKPCSTH